MSRKSFTSSRRPAADWEARSGRGQPTLMKSVEIQTDSPSHTFGEYQDAYEVLGRGSGGRGVDDIYAEDAADAAANDWQAAYSSARGYQGLPVAEPVRFMNPYGKTVSLSPMHAPGPAATVVRDGGGVPAFYRAGRNGSNWRHVTQCTGNLGNHMVYINGRVKADDCQRYPPHGFSAGCGLGAQAAPAAGVRALAATTSRRPKTGGVGPEISKALLRARAGNKYWFEDKRPPTMTPSTIQGRIMKSGAAY